MNLNKNRVFLLRQTIVKMTQVLTNSGIEVTQRGISAYVRTDEKTSKPVQVNLPYLPDDAPEELIDAIQGFLDHEVAHIMFTDFTVMKKIEKMAPRGSAGKLHTFWNILEDARIEAAMAQQFRGSGANLTTTGQFFINSVITPRMAELDADASAKESDYTASLLMPALRAAAGQLHFQQFMDDNGLWVKVPTLERAISVFAKKIASMGSTQEALDLAKALMDEMSPPAPTPPAPAPAPAPAPSTPPEDEEEPAPSEEDEKEPSPTPSAPSEEDEEGEEGEGEPSSTPPEEGEGEGEPSSTPPEEEEEEGEGEGEGEEEEEGEGEEEGEAFAGQPAPSETGDPEDSAGLSDASESSDELPESENDGENKSSDALSNIDEDGANSYDESLSRAISSAAAESADSSQYLVYTTDHDKLELMKIGSGYSPSMLVSLQAKVEAMVGPIQKDLERAMVARSRRQWEGGLRSGRLNVSALSRAATGDDRLFRRRTESTTKEVAISLVIDASGSMSGSKIHTAAAAAFALSQVLERLKVPHEVICFTTGALPSEDWQKLADEQRDHNIRFSRTEPLNMPIIKGFDERLASESMQRFAWLPNANFFANNVDGESILIAAQRLAARKEAGKSLIVLSDGCPSCHGSASAASAHLRKTVKVIEKSGINVIGIGIQSTDVTRYYDKNLVIHDVKELPEKVMTELRKHLMG